MLHQNESSIALRQSGSEHFFILKCKLYATAKVELVQIVLSLRTHRGLIQFEAPSINSQLQTSALIKFFFRAIPSGLDSMAGLEPV